MDDKVKVWLYDMLNAIVEIDSFFDGYLDFEIYKRILKLKGQSNEILKSSEKR